MNRELKLVLNGQLEMISRASLRMAAALCLLGTLSIAHGAPVVATGSAAASLDAAESSTEADAASNAKKAKVLRAYAKLPMHFEANGGQHHGAVKYSARGRGYQLFLTGNESVLVLKKLSAAPLDARAELEQMSDRVRGRERARAPEQRIVVRRRFEGANADPAVVGENLLPGKSHYFMGPDRSQWHTNISNYSQVRYRGVYPGIDVVHYGSQGTLEYDWVVAPGADPHRIVEAFDGVTGLRIDANGDLILDTPGGGIWQKKPDIYQEIGGKRVPVEGGYVLLGRNTVGFKIGRYDSALPLVIDPTLQYSSFLGGIRPDWGSVIAVSPAGEAYIAGKTASNDFPHTTFFNFHDGSFVPFITKLNAAGDAIGYSAVFAFGGGGQDDTVAGISLKEDGSAYIGGNTRLRGFTGSTTIIGPDSTSRAFTLLLSPDGSVITQSTTISPGFATSFAVDPSGSAYIAGLSAPLSFVFKLTPDGTSLAYSTLIGDPSNALAPDGFPIHTDINALVVDSQGNAFFGGLTNSPNYPLDSSGQGVVNGTPGPGGFAAKLNASGTAFLYTSYFPGAGLGAIALDSQGNAYIAGPGVFPSNNPLPGTAVPPIPGLGPSVAKLDPTGSVVFSTPLSSPLATSSTFSKANGITVDRIGDIYVTGFANAPFPLVQDFGVHGAGSDVFLVKIAPDLNSLLFSTLIGGSGEDIGIGIAADAVGGVYVVGRTASGNFPLSGGLFSPFHGGGFDAFVLKVSDPIPPVVLLSSSNPSALGQPVVVTAIVTAVNATGTVTFSDGATVLGTVPLNASGVAKLTVTAFSAAAHSITASYSGDATHAAASASIVQIVNASPKDSTTTLSASTTSLPANQTVTLTATVTGTNGATPTGSVSFVDGGTAVAATLSGGSASVTLSNLSAGLHSVTAQYGGDALNKPSVSASVAITVIGPPVVSISAPANGSIFEYPATVSITAIASAATGASLAKVDLLLNEAPLVSLPVPPYTFAWANAPPGVYQLTARAVDNFGQATVSAAVQVQIHLQGITYYHHDLQGNVIATTDSFAAVVYTESYQPFGGRLVADPAGQVAQTNGNRLWFHGKAQDEGTGLQYFGARYYDPAIGRFMGVDPAAFSDTNIHSFNRYAYGNNNPYRYQDPDGNSPIDIAFLAVDLVKLGVAIYKGEGVGGAVIDVGLSVVGVISPIPGVGLAIKAERAAVATERAAEAGKTLYHYTNAAGAKGIAESGVIKANEQGRVFLTEQKLSKEEAANRLFVGNTDKGSHVVEVEMKSGAAIREGKNRNEIIHQGSIREGRQANLTVKPNDN